MDLNLNSLLFISAIIGFTGSFISLFMSKWIAKRRRVLGLSREQIMKQKNGLKTLDNISLKFNIKTPEFGIFDSQQLNAFATGASKNNSLVALSTGLINHMSKDEIEAVIAHEVAHIKNGDMVTMTLIQGIINTFVIFFSRVIGHLVDRIVFKVQRGHGPAYYITSIIAQILLSILASIVMWFSRKENMQLICRHQSLLVQIK